MKPICFMIIPYGTKPTQAEVGKGVANIDFNALWDSTYAPVIEELGYERVRADQDVDALIIVQMIERLYFADLVLAEMAIPEAKSLADEACETSPPPAITLAALRLWKDSADTADDWTWFTDFVGRLSADLASLEEVRETNAFALGNAGKPNRLGGAFRQQLEHVALRHGVLARDIVKHAVRFRFELGEDRRFS
jgi:hypothetical protein